MATACCAEPATHVVSQVIAQRLSKLGTFNKARAPERLAAEVLIKRKKRRTNGETVWEIVRARGHLDEVLEMRKGGSKLGMLRATPTLMYAAKHVMRCRFMRLMPHTCPAHFTAFLLNPRIISRSGPSWLLHGALVL